MQTPPRDIGFLFLGGMHQALHMAPVAVALARRGQAVTAYAPPEDGAALAAMLAALDASAAASIAVVPLSPGAPTRLLRTLAGGRIASKPLMLVEWRRRLLRHDALVAAERTSTLLKRWPGRRPFMIHIPHGAGDRARGFDPRVRFFDEVLVNGPTVYARTIAQGAARPDRCRIIGSVKLGALAASDRPIPRLFPDDRPVVLYNPHFDTRLSSWAMAPALVNAIAADGRFNLVVAPHARLGTALDEGERAAWRRRGERPGVLVDLGSAALWDMTYTRAADVYLGDVSSQVYEFMYRPRPAVFLDAHAAAWRDSPDYAMWAMGDVAATVPAAIDALGHAAARHAGYRATQERLVAAMLGPVDAGVPDRAAEAVLACLPARGDAGALDRPSPA